MQRAQQAAALLLLLGLAAIADGQSKGPAPINSLDDALAAAKNEKKLIVISFENPK